MKSIIFKLGNLLRKLKYSASQAFQLAWQLVTKKPSATVSFRKEDDTERTAEATITSIALNKAGELYARFTEVVESVLQHRSFSFNRLNSITF